MGPPVIVDTDIFIDFSLDDSYSVQTMAYLENNFTITISVITAMELYSGIRSKKEKKEVDRLVSDIPVEFVTKPISEKAFELLKEYRPGYGVEINDMLIAATAMTLEAKMISKNQKHYKFLPDIDLLEYPLNV